MNKILWVAWREFETTALTKSFILGILMTPVFIIIIAGAMAAVKAMGTPRIVGEVAVIDQSGLLGDRLQKRFTPEGIQQQADKLADQAGEALKQKSQQMGLPADQTGIAASAVQGAIKQAAASGPKLSLTMLPPDSDVEKEKQLVADAKITTTKNPDADVTPSRIALIIVKPETVTGNSDGKFPAFDAFFADRLDFEVQDKVQDRVADSVVDARLDNNAKLQASGLTPQDVRTLMGRPRAEAKTVSKEGDEKKSIGALQFMIPLAFMILLMVAVFTGGQYLLTTTVEEKGNRVMEVLLSAVSPMQLMTGKILGQMGVGIVILLLYSGTGIVGLFIANQSGLVKTSQIVYLVVFFIIAYFLVASMMAAVGAAVNDMREAQTLMTPVMILLMIPWMIWFLIQRAPNSILATVLSFVPGTNPFVMVIRLSGSEPVPTWQIPVSIAVGVLSVIAMLYVAAKIFRVGALMYGKPPNFKTLVRWVRMA